MMPSRIDGLDVPAAPSAGMRSASPGPAFNFHAVESVRLRPVLALSVGAVVFFLIVSFALTRVPTYRAQSLVYVEPLASKVLDDGSTGIYDPSRYESYLQQQIETAQRPDILEKAIEKLPPGTWARPGEDIHSAAARLAGALKVQRDGQSYQIAISLSDSNPRVAAEVVNAATNAYLEQGRKEENVRSDGRLQLLGEERDRIQAELAADRAEQAALGARLGVADPGAGGGNPYDLQLAGIRTELISARQAHDVAAAQLESVSGKAGVDSPGLKSVADDVIANDPGLSALKSTLNQRRAALVSQMAGLTPSNPVYEQDQEEISKLDRGVDARSTQLRTAAEKKVEDRLRLELQRTGDVEAKLNAQLARQTAEAHDAAPKLQRASELTSEITRLQARYATVDDAMRGLELETNGPGTAHLAVAATPPAAPEPSKRLMLLALSLPLAIFAGIAAAVFAKRRDPRVYTAGDVADGLGFLPISVMPAYEEVSRAVIEEYLLRTAAALERAYRVSSARSFVFTAVSASTDSSTLVVEVRRKLSEMGFRTIALRASQALATGRRSRLSRPDEDSAVGSGIVKSQPGQQEGFAAAKLEKLKRKYDFVLIDAPPLLHSAEAEYAIRSTEATIVVLESAITTRSELRQAGLLLERLNVTGVGAVLKDLHLKVGNSEFRSSIAVMEKRGREGASSWRPAEAPILELRMQQAARKAASKQYREERAPEPMRFARRFEEYEEPAEHEEALLEEAIRSLSRRGDTMSDQEIRDEIAALRESLRNSAANSDAEHRESKRGGLASFFGFGKSKRKKVRKDTYDSSPSLRIAPREDSAPAYEPRTSYQPRETPDFDDSRERPSATIVFAEGGRERTATPSPQAPAPAADVKNPVVYKVQDEPSTFLDSRPNRPAFSHSSFIESAPAQSSGPASGTYRAVPDPDAFAQREQPSAGGLSHFREKDIAPQADTPAWLESAEADRIRKLVARVDEESAKHAVATPSPIPPMPSYTSRPEAYDQAIAVVTDSFAGVAHQDSGSTATPTFPASSSFLYGSQNGSAASRSAADAWSMPEPEDKPAFSTGWAAPQQEARSEDTQRYDAWQTPRASAWHSEPAPEETPWHAAPEPEPIWPAPAGQPSHHVSATDWLSTLTRAASNGNGNGNGNGNAYHASNGNGAYASNGNGQPKEQPVLLTPHEDGVPDSAPLAPWQPAVREEVAAGVSSGVQTTAAETPFRQYADALSHAIEEESHAPKYAARQESIAEPKPDAFVPRPAIASAPAAFEPAAADTSEVERPFAPAVWSAPAEPKPEQRPAPQTWQPAPVQAAPVVAETRKPVQSVAVAEHPDQPVSFDEPQRAPVRTRIFPAELAGHANGNGNGHSNGAAPAAPKFAEVPRHSGPVPVARPVAAPAWKTRVPAVASVEPVMPRAQHTPRRWYMLSQFDPGADNAQTHELKERAAG